MMKQVVQRETIRCVRLDRGESGAKKVLPHWMCFFIRKYFLSALYFYQEESYPDSYGCLKERSKENRNNKRRGTSSVRELVINWSVKVPKSKQGVGCSTFFFIDWNLLNKMFVYIQLSSRQKTIELPRRAGPKRMKGYRECI